MPGSESARQAMDTYEPIKACRTPDNARQARDAYRMSGPLGAGQALAAPIAGGEWGYREL